MSKNCNVALTFIIKLNLVLNILCLKIEYILKAQAFTYPYMSHIYPRRLSLEVLLLIHPGKCHLSSFKLLPTLGHYPFCAPSLVHCREKSVTDYDILV